MLADDGVLRFGQRTRLVEDRLRQTDLADVVQLGGEAEPFLRSAIELERGGKPAGPARALRIECPDVYGSRASSVRTRVDRREKRLLELLRLPADGPFQELLIAAPFAAAAPGRASGIAARAGIRRAEPA